VTSGRLAYEDGCLLVQEGHYYFHTTIDGKGGGKGTTVRLFCLDAASGRVLWRRGSLLLDRDPVVYRGVLYGISGCNDCLAIEVKTGRVLWTTDVGQLDEVHSVVYSCCSMLLANGVLYRVTTVSPFTNTGIKSQILAIDAVSGRVLWHGPVPDGCGARCAGLAYGDGKFFGSSPGGNAVEAYGPDRK